MHNVYLWYYYKEKHYMTYKHFYYTNYSCDEYGNVFGPRNKPIGTKNPVNQYCVICVYKDGAVKQFRKHRFIMECITGKPIPDNMVINHINGIKTDNSYKNLEIVTYSENTQHALRIGLITPKKGELNGNCTITEETARGIIRLIVNTNLSNKEIGERFGISTKHISSIRHKRRWRHLYDEPEFSDYTSSNSINRTEDFFNRQLVITAFVLNTNLPQSTLSSMFNIDMSTISRIRNHKLYNKAIEVCLKPESSTTIESLMTPSELVEYRQATGSGVPLLEDDIV